MHSLIKHPHSASSEASSEKSIFCPSSLSCRVWAIVVLSHRAPRSPGGLPRAGPGLCCGRPLSLGTRQPGPSPECNGKHHVSMRVGRQCRGPWSDTASRVSTEGGWGRRIRICRQSAAHALGDGVGLCRSTDGLSRARRKAEEVRADPSCLTVGASCPALGLTSQASPGLGPSGSG